MTTPLTLTTLLTCPACGHASEETMPLDACVFFHVCAGCGTRLRPKEGDCCVFCSYGADPCPPRQAQTEYAPIDCSLHDRLEAFATRAGMVDITWQDEGGATRMAKARIADVFARGGEEFVATEDGLEIRLDRLIAVGGVEFRRGCC